VLKVMIALCCSMFMNVFSGDLYVNGTNNGSLNQIEEALVLNHTMWYCFWCFGQILEIFLQYFALTLFVYPDVPNWLRAIFLFSLFELITSTMVTTTKVFAYDTYTLPDDEIPRVLYVAKNISEALMLPKWHWVPILFFRLSIGQQLGVKLNLSLMTPDDKHDPQLPAAGDLPGTRSKHLGIIDPESLICIAHQFIGCITLITFFFTDGEGAGSEFVTPILLGFRVTPYVYLFAPAWNLYFAFMIFGLLMTLIREYLQTLDGVRELDDYCSPNLQRQLRTFNAVVWLISILFISWTVRTEMQGLEWLILLWGLSVPVWVALNVGLECRQILFIWVWIILAVGALFFQTLAYIHLGLMCTFSFWVDDIQDIKIESITVVGAAGASAAIQVYPSGGVLARSTTVSNAKLNVMTRTPQTEMQILQ